MAKSREVETLYLVLPELFVVRLCFPILQSQGAHKKSASPRKRPHLVQGNGRGRMRESKRLTAVLPGSLDPTHQCSTHHASADLAKMMLDVGGGLIKRFVKHGMAIGETHPKRMPRNGERYSGSFGAQEFLINPRMLGPHK